MAIEATCPGCNEFFRLPDALAGKQVSCQRCSTLWTVPQATVPAAEEVESAEEVAEEVAPPSPKSAKKSNAPEMAKAVNPKRLSPALPARSLSSKPKNADIVDGEPIPVKPKKSGKKQLDEKASSRAGCLLVALALFLVSMVSAGGLVAIWFALTVNSNNPIVAGPKDRKDEVVKDRQDDAGVDKIVDKDRDKGLKDKVKINTDKDKVNTDKDKIEPIKDDRNKDKDKVDGVKPPAPPKILDPKERADFADQLQGGRREYRVQMQFGKRYNFQIQKLDFPAKLQLDDGQGIIVTRNGNKAVFLSHIALRTGEHTLVVTPQTPRNSGGFDFKFAQSTPDLPTPIGLGGNTVFTAKDSLRIQDGVALDWANSPIREYRMSVTPGHEYELTVEPIGHAPRLRIYEGASIDAPNRAGDWAVHPDAKKIEAVYKATFNGVVTVTVASDDQQFGSYVLTVKRREVVVAKNRPEPREVVLDFAGKFHKDDLLDDTDPFEGRHGRSKVYIIPMEAGQSYNIDQKSKEIDAFLTLLDPKGKLVAEDNNGGGNYNARLLFDARETGKYRLLASDFKRKTGDYTIDIARFKTPISAVANGPLAMQKRENDGCEVIETTAPPIASQNTSFAWAPDGRAFFMLDKNNTLRRFKFPELVEDRRIELIAGVTTLHLCAEGMLLSNTTSRELWLVDPDTLELKRRMPRLGNTGIFTSPALASALIPGNLLRPDGTITPGLGRHDLTKSTVSYMGDLPKGTIFQAITPDEKYLLARSPDNKIMRLRLDKKATLEEISGSNARSWFGANHPFLVSPDGRLVLHPVNTKTIPKDDVLPAPASGYGIAAYRVNDLRRPVFVFDTGVSTNAVAFDPKSGHLIAQNRSKGIMVISPQGQLVASCNIDLGGDVDMWNMVAHPGGGKILGFTGATTAPKLFVIELPRNIPVPKLVEDKGEPRKVAFAATDFYRNDDKLAAGDPRDTDGLPHKTYLIPMEAGWAYSIDQRSTMFDSYLKLIDPTGKVLATDDDSGGDVHARILFEPKAPGEFKVLAARNKGNAFGDFTFEVLRFKLPVKEAVNKSVAGKKDQIAGATVVETQFGVAQLATNSSVFTSDGKTLLLLDGDGWLRKISVPELQEEARLHVGKDFKQIYPSPDGPIIANVKLREIWIIDANQLSIAKRVPMVGGPQLHAAALAPVAFAPALAKLPDGKSIGMVVGHDLNGKLPPHMTLLPGGPIGVYGVTPDGKYMIGRSPKNELLRWKADERKLVVDQTGDAFSLIFTTPPIIISGDSRWVMRAVDKKAGPLDKVDPAPESGFGWVVYHVTDLAHPAFVIDTGTKTATAASDPKAGYLFTHSASKGLMICDLDGRSMREIPIATGLAPDARIWRMTVSPQGGKLFAFTGAAGSPSGYYVELPKDLPPVRTVAAKLPPDPIKGREFPKGLDPLPILDGAAVIRKFNGVFLEPLWSPDGRTFFMAQSGQGFLEVDGRDLTVKKKNLALADAKGIFFKGKMAWSTEGLLAIGFEGNPNNGENMQLYIIDPLDLTVKKRIPAPNTAMVQSAPSSSVAFAGGRNSFAGGNPAELLIIDLKSGKVTKPNVEFAIHPETFKVSPDGKYLYATDGRAIARFKIDGTNLVQEEVSKEFALNKFQQQIELSADGKLVWLLSQNIPPSQAKIEFPTTMLDAMNLTKTEKVVKHRAYSFAIDPRDQLMVLAGGDHKLRELDKDLNIAREYDLKAPAGFRPNLQMNPQGGDVLIHSQSYLYHVRMPDRKVIDLPKKIPDDK